MDINVYKMLELLVKNQLVVEIFCEKSNRQLQLETEEGALFATQNCKKRWSSRVVKLTKIPRN